MAWQPTIRLMKNNTSLLLFFVLSLVIEGTSRAQSTIIANTFGPGNSFNPNVGMTAAWHLLYEDFGQGIAAPFSVNGGSYLLDSVTLALSHEYYSSTMTISIVRDNAGMPSGQVVETVTSDLASVTSDPQVVTFASSLNPVMPDGGVFWLVIEPPAQNLSNNDDNSIYSWYASGMLGTTAIRNFDFGTENWLPWQVYGPNLLPAFSIEGSAVPEPGTLSLLLLGAGWVGFRGGRKFRFKAK